MIQHLQVVLKNHPGELFRMVRALAEASVSMKALNVADRGDGSQGQADVIVDNLSQAVEALKTADFSVSVTEALAVQVDDRVGGLAAVLEILSQHRIGIQQLYAFVARVQGKSLALVSVDNLELAAELLTASGFVLVSRQALEAKAPSTRPTLSDHLGLDFIW